MVLVESSEDPLDLIVFRVLWPTGPNGHQHDFQQDWEKSLALVRERTGKLGYPRSAVVDEMTKLGWEMTRLDFIKVQY